MGGHEYQYLHLQWREGSRVKSKHVPAQQVKEIQIQIEERKKYEQNRKSLMARVRALKVFVDVVEELE